MVPTEYGKCILPRARRAIDDLQAIPALLQKHHTRTSGPLADAGWLFNTRRLAIFIQLYHVNHTQTVAQQLGITQPAVSAALKVTEKGADSALFRRTPEGVRPTPAAELLYPPVSRALNELENIWSDLAARRGVLEGTVRIGALPLSRTRLLPSAIAAFLAQHPGITLMTNESPYESLVADMRAGNIDFIIGALRQDEDLPDLCSEALFEEDMLILLRNNHPLLRHPDPRSQLATAQWCCRAPTRRRAICWIRRLSPRCRCPSRRWRPGMRRWCEDCCRTPTCWRRFPPARCVLKLTMGCSACCRSPCPIPPGVSG